MKNRGAREKKLQKALDKNLPKLGPNKSKHTTRDNSSQVEGNWDDKWPTK